MRVLPSIRVSRSLPTRPGASSASPGGGTGCGTGLSTSSETARTTIGRDLPFAVKDQAGTVAGPRLVSTLAVVREAPVIVSLHFDAGTCICPQLSYVAPIASVRAGRGSRTLAETLDPFPKSMRVVPPDPSFTPGAMVTCPAPHATFCSVVSKPRSGVRDEYKKIPAGGFGIPTARTTRATACARSRNTGGTEADGTGVCWFALLAPEGGAASFPQAASAQAMRTTAGHTYARHPALRRMDLMLVGRSRSGKSLRRPSWAEYRLASARRQDMRWSRSSARHEATVGDCFVRIGSWRRRLLGCFGGRRSSGQINGSRGSGRIGPSSRVGRAMCWPGRVGISIPIRGSLWRPCTWVTLSIRFTCMRGGARGPSMRRVGTSSPNSCRSTATSKVCPSGRWRRSAVTFGSSVKRTCIDNRTSTGPIRQNAHAPMYADTTRPGSRRLTGSYSVCSSSGQTCS